MTIEPRATSPVTNRTTLQQVKLSALKSLNDEARRHSKRDAELARQTVARLPVGAPTPIIINAQLEILDGHEFVQALKELGVEQALVLQHDGMTPLEQRQFRVAIDQLQSRGTWDPTGLDSWVRMFERDLENFDHAMLGFDNGELDKILGIGSRINGEEEVIPALSRTSVSTVGTVWVLNQYRLLVGDATSRADFNLLMDGQTAAAAHTDPPFGCEIDGFVSKKGKHRNFVQGAGEMTEEQLLAFFSAFAGNLAAVLRPGGLVYAFIDWRSQYLLQQAFEPVFGKLLQLVCWAKDRGGMGGLYRSQHELVFVYRNAGGKHVNAVQLGKHGRNRSNVWDYPCAASSRSGREGDMLTHHPTPKPVEMIADAILDCTHHGDIVVDCFLGSGTTLMAAERTGRRCYGIELDPLYADLVVRRWQKWTGEEAIDAATGRTFNDIESATLEREGTNNG